MTVERSSTLLEVIANLQSGLAERGYHFLSHDDAAAVWDHEESMAGRLQRLHLLADACGARCETDNELRSIRFTPMRERENRDGSSFAHRAKEITSS